MCAEVRLKDTNGIHHPKRRHHATEGTEDDEPSTETAFGISDLILRLARCWITERLFAVIIVPDLTCLFIGGIDLLLYVWTMPGNLFRA